MTLPVSARNYNEKMKKNSATVMFQEVTLFFLSLSRKRLLLKGYYKT